mmetsp:Transcript_54359/g.145089  ORF Transcript_54359/g.145089 Transcript_54359/m.145089 type:complete len:200 (+) Transcript_54359:1960-2559(+)
MHQGTVLSCLGALPGRTSTAWWTRHEQGPTDPGRFRRYTCKMSVQLQAAWSGQDTLCRILAQAPLHRFLGCTVCTRHRGRPHGARCRAHTCCKPRNETAHLDNAPQGTDGTSPCRTRWPECPTQLGRGCRWTMSLHQTWCFEKFQQGMAGTESEAAGPCPGKQNSQAGSPCALPRQVQEAGARTVPTLLVALVLKNHPR